MNLFVAGDITYGLHKTVILLDTLPSLSTQHTLCWVLYEQGERGAGPKT